jgi:CDP-glucose 4,6-dehydratase
VQAIIVVTTDKVYRNVGHTAPYVESDELGGREPYSASKAASEFVIDAWYHSYLDDQGKGVAAIRAGNIFGGGDWAADRLVPDAIRTFSAGKPLVLRNPASTRPWQHVLDPLRGYLTLAENLTERPADFSGKWNFGPEMQDCRPVVDLAGLLAANWSSDSRVEVDSDESVFEERFLALDSSKAAERLGWIPRWPLEVGVQKVVEWHQAQAKGANMWEATQTQIIAMEREETNA